MFLAACSRQREFDPSQIIFVIESNPVNLDPRYASDAQSQRIDKLLFDGLVERDAEMNLHGDLAESWNTPDALTYIFHLREGVTFHDGRALTSKDVKATVEFMMNAANRSPKRGAFRMINSIEAPDAETVVFHLKEPAASFLWNMERSAVGIAPADAGPDFSRKPIGSGPYRFVSQSQDDAVVIERNANYFRAEADPQLPGKLNAQAQSLQSAQVGSISAPPVTVAKNVQQSTMHIERVTFRIVPDAIVRALELRKGSADIEVSSLSPDMIPVLAKQADLAVSERTGTNFAYLGMNMQDAIIGKREVRQALAYATDRESLIKYLLRSEAQLASGILPPNHWAYDGNVKKYEYDPAAAERLLEAAGFPRRADGTRMHVILKVSTDEQARLLGAALQEQWRGVGVELEVRPL
ncbi:MAG: ABC transporter substrate-binding protein, partial [Candidatus Acidiferrum sp.]